MLTFLTVDGSDISAGRYTEPVAFDALFVRKVAGRRRDGDVRLHSAITSGRLP